MANSTILVTGTGGRSVGSGILHCLLRSSGDVPARWDVIAADADPFAWALYQTKHRAILPMRPEYYNVPTAAGVSP